jgi:hypothetical protein
LCFPEDILAWVTRKSVDQVHLSMPRIPWLVLAFAAASACGGSASSPMEPIPSSTIIGDFGGAQVLLHATSSGVDIQFSCMEVTVTKSLTTDATGHFTASGGRRRSGGAITIGGEPSTPVRLDGYAYLTQGGTLQLIVSDIPEEPGAPISWADTLTLVRDKKATIYLCP